MAFFCCICLVGFCAATTNDGDDDDVSDKGWAGWIWLDKGWILSNLVLTLCIEFESFPVPFYI